MTLGRMPLVVWLNFVSAGMVLIVLTPLAAAQIMLMLDRYLGAHFFDTQAGGSAVLWQHFFWIFGHPEVYVLMLPGFGFASEIIPVFSRKTMFGYPAMVGATVAIGFVGMGVWAHHMFTIGMSSAANTFFMIATMVVGVPTGIKIFNWIATMWGGKIRFAHADALLHRVPLPVPDRRADRASCWPPSRSTGSSATRTSSSRTSTTCWSADSSSRSSARSTTGFPKATGRMLDETLGKWHFWLFVIGFHLTFDYDAHPRAAGHAAAHLHL